MNNVLEFTDKNFKDEINKTDKPVIVDFYAPWCGHCRVQAPILEELAKENSDALIAKINVDENREMAAKYFISGIPAILVFKEGKLVEQKAGVHRKDELSSLIKKYV